MGPIYVKHLAVIGEVPNLDLMKKGLSPCANLSVLCALAVHIKSGADTQEIKGRIG